MTGNETLSALFHRKRVEMGKKGALGVKGAPFEVIAHTRSFGLLSVTMVSFAAMERRS